MRSKTVSFAGKDITVRERKIKELTQLADQLSTDINNLIKVNDFSEAKNAITTLFQSQLPTIFPGVKEEDIEETYPSELEELVQAFVDVNFFGIKKVIIPLLKLAQR